MLGVLARVARVLEDESAAKGVGMLRRGLAVLSGLSLDSQATMEALASL